MKRILPLLCSLYLCLLSQLVQAQTTPNVDSLARHTPPTTMHPAGAEAPIENPSIQGEVVPMTAFEFKLSVLVLSFGFLVVLLEIYLIKIKVINAENTIKFIVITLIIIGTLFLITAGYSNNQIAPAIGLLGTIAGYLLGKAQPTSIETAAAKENTNA